VIHRQIPQSAAPTPAPASAPRPGRLARAAQEVRGAFKALRGK
jgi:hypothetical protein